MTKSFFTKARWLVTIILLILFAVPHAWGTSYISYEDSDQDASTTISSSNVSNGSAGRISWTGTSCTYSSSRVNIAANGSITFTAASGYEITKIVITSGSSASYYGTWTSTPAGGTPASANVATLQGFSASSVTVTTSTAFRCTSASTIKIYYTAAASSPSLTASPTSLNWGTVNKGASLTTKTFNISGSNLTGNLSVATTGGYSVSCGSSITVTSGSPSVTTITVTPPSTATAGTKNGTITISGGGLVSSVAVSCGLVVNEIDQFIDELQNTSGYTSASPHIEAGSYGTTPKLTDKAVATSGTCEEQHYHFVGWITKTKYDAGTSIAIGDLQTPTSATGATYYAVWAKQAAGGGEVSDVINNSVTSSHLGGSGTSSWVSIWETSALTSGAKYKIYSMGINGASNYALQWNSSGYLFCSSAPSAGLKLKSITIKTLATKNIGLYGSTSVYTGKASSTSLSTLSATTSGATYALTSDQLANNYTCAGINGTASSTQVVSITITYSSVSYEDYIAKCCTPLGQINGSFSLTQSNGVLTATLPSASKNANATSYRFTLYNNSNVEITHKDVATGAGDVSTTFGSSDGVNPGTTYKVSVTPLVSPQGSFCSTTGTESDKASITMHYTVTLAVNNAEYGSISPTSTLYVASGTSISASTNTLSVGATNITATYRPQTAQYTYGFTNWTWSPSGATITANTTATANFTRSTRTYNVTTTGITHATASPAIPATVAYGGSITTTITADANYTLPSAITVTGATLDNWNSSTGALSITEVTGDVSITITATTAMKRIYMNTDGTAAGKWGADSPKFFIHSWGSSDYDVEMVAQPCASNVFYADIPEANTNLLFTRQDPSAGSSIIYKDNTGNWGQSVNITISTNNYFTFNGNWNVESSGKSGFNAGTYTPDMKTIYLSFCAAWLENNPLFGLYDVTHSTWMSTFAEAGTGCYAGYYIAQVPSCATTVLIGRFKPGTPAPFGWSGENWWGQSVDFTIGSDTYDKITIEGWGDTGEAKDKGYGTLGTFALTQYTVSFAGGGGTGSMSSLTNKDCGSDVTLPNVSFTKTGYDFDGWHADVDVKVGGATIPAGSTIANQATIQDIRSNVALTAQWVAKEYTITLDREGASTGSESVTMTYNSSSHTAITAPTKTGYNFGGWYSGDNGTGSQVMNASGVLQANVDGYTGAGGVWTRTTTPTTLYAKWIAKEYTITLDREGASTGATSVTATYDAGTLAGWSAPSKTGYTFGGYWSGDNGTGTLVISTTGALQNSVTISSVAWTDGSGHWVKDGGATVYAKWTANVYNITYKDQGDVAYSGNATAGVPTGAPTTHTYGSATALVDGVKDGYRFDGWFTDASCTVSAGSSIGATAKTADFTLYAKWTQVYTVTWSVNGETWESGVVEGNTHVPGGSKVSALPTAPTSSDCDDSKVFVGWRATEIDGESTSDPGGIFTTRDGSPTISAKTDFFAVFADESGGDNTLVTNVSELTAGTQVYFYAETSDEPAFTAVMKAYESGNNVRAVSGSVSTNKLTPSEGACLYTIGITTGTYAGYTFKDGTNSYLYAASTSANQLKSRADVGDDGYAEFSITITDGLCAIASRGNTSRGVLQFNKNNDNGNYASALFACYGSASDSRQNVKLFKKNPLTYSKFVTSCASCDANATFTNTTPTVSDIDCTTATLTMEDGLATLGAVGCNISDYGFVIGTSDNPAIGGSGVTKLQVGTTNPTTGEDFSYDATGLTKGTHYYIRAYAINRNGTAYSTNSQNFWTNNVSSIAITTAPTKTNYIVGETFDATGMVVTATMASGATEDVTSDVTYSSSALTAGTSQNFAINYTLCETAKSVNQVINVYTLTVTEGTKPSYGTATNSSANIVSITGLGDHKTYTVTVTSSNATAVDNGDNTWSIINPTGNVTVRVDYADAVQVKVYYKVDGVTVTGLTQDVYQSETTTLPTASELATAMTAQGMDIPDDDYPNFYGWSETEFPAQTAEPTIVTGTPTINAEKTYYAVYTNLSKKQILPSDFAGSYATNEGAQTIDGLGYNIHDICLQSSKIQFRNTPGYLYSTSALSYIKKIEITGLDLIVNACSDNAGTLDGDAITPTGSDTYVYTFPASKQYFKIKGKGGTDKVSLIEIFYASSTVYYMTEFCATKITLTQNSPEHGTVEFGRSSLATCGSDKNVSLTIIPDVGYQLTGWTVNTSSGYADAKTTSPAVVTNSNNSAAQNITLTFAQDANKDYDVTATFGLMTVTSWAWTLNSAAIPDPLNLYVGQSARLDVAYTPAGVDASKKMYTRTKVDAYINWVGVLNANYTTISGKASTGESTTEVTFTHADGPSTTVNVKVLPLPLVHFGDIVHNVEFDDVVATLSDNTLSPTKTTPTHADFDGSTANRCEEQHLHLVGWIREDWPALVTYLNGGAQPSTDDITGAGNDGSGNAYFFTPGASINTQTFNGVTFYAVWAKVE